MPMSTNLEAKRYPIRLCVEEKTMRREKVIRTTLGELIVAVTDEVMPFVENPPELYIATSYVLNELLAHHRLRIPGESRIFSSHFLRALH